ncbi:hypothetical protein RGI145_16955 [Roseomonas gilardii]|uniref:Uncharacterized protein n=1 Tax=Roseomonas gilardii TaxID=257708 RepID=A0A1L7AIA6_9PROT|nr:hypothetical protein RGI145_16955 [Roseomonas gilardii]
MRASWIALWATLVPAMAHAESITCVPQLKLDEGDDTFVPAVQDVLYILRPDGAGWVLERIRKGKEGRERLAACEYPKPTQARCRGRVEATYEAKDRLMTLRTGRFSWVMASCQTS